MAQKEKLEEAKRLYQTANADQRYVLESLFPELKESEDERIRKELIFYLRYQHSINENFEDIGKWIAWLENIPYTIDHEKREGFHLGYKAGLEKQGEQKPTQEIEPFEAEHGKYYYCIKDYFCGGRKQASKGDVVQALRGLPIMGLKDASEYFLPVNFIKCNSAWGEEDEEMCQETIDWFEKKCFPYTIGEENPAKDSINWLKSIKQKIKGE